MQLGYVIVYTSAVEASVAFYEAAFGLTRRFVHESGQYAEMETGSTVLAFADDELGQSNVSAYRKNVRGQEPAGIELVLVTPALRDAYERAIGAGATSVAEPQTKPWGQDVAYVLDNNGVLVELATPMG